MSMTREQFIEKLAKEAGFRKFVDGGVVNFVQPVKK